MATPLPPTIDAGLWRNRVAAAAILALVLGCVVWLSSLSYDGQRFTSVPAYAFRGDEPHYLLVINSLLADHDLDLRADYARVRRGGPEAGHGFRGQNLDHHSFIVDLENGKHKNWTEVFWWNQSVACPQENPDCVGFVVKDPVFAAAHHVREVPSHPIAFPAVLALAIAPWWRGPEHTEELASKALLAILLVGILLTYFIARRAGLSRGFALGAAAVLALASSWLAFGKSFFSEPLIGVSLGAGLLAMLAYRPRAAALAVVFAVWLKPIFVLVGVAWAATLWLRGQRRAALWHAGIVVMGIAGLCMVNYSLARTPLIAGNLGWMTIQQWWWPLRTLFDPEHGLLPFVPWAALAFVGVALGLRRASAQAQNPEFARFAIFVAPPALLLLALFASHGPLGGTCYGPRYWVPLLPWLAVAFAEIVARGRHLLCVLAGMMVFAAILIAVPGAIRRHRSWDCPPQVALTETLDSPTFHGCCGH